MNKGSIVAAMMIAMAEQAAQRAQQLNLYLSTSSRGYNQIPNKHRKHKRGKPK